jgi:exopolysaccharide biosynthesis polyprenyl glycosylphosphotransferase
MNSAGSRSLRGLIQLADVVLLVLAMVSAYGLHALLRTSFGFFRAPAGSSGFILLGYLALPLWLFLVPLLRLDQILEARWSLLRTIFRLLELTLLGFGALTVVTFITQTVVNRSIVVTFLALSFAFLLGSRIAITAWVKRQHKLGHARRRLLLIGEPGEAMQRFVAGQSKEAFPPEVVGYLGRREPDSAWPELPHRLGPLGHLPAVLHGQAVDEVVVLDQLSQRRAGWVLGVCADLGLGAQISLPWQNLPRVTAHLEIGAVSHFLSFSPTARHAAQLAVKQVLDLVLTVMGVLILLPLFAAVWLAIRVSDGKPAIFSQVRVGLHGRRFRMLKFRTMVRDADALKAQLASLNELDGPAFKLTHDPRVTRLGAFLRRTSLDELPQLFNVLEGSMSLVGPRPLPESEQQRIRGAQRRRLSMKPGITGLWQVSGRNDVGFAEWMRLDQAYVDQWSLWLDLILLLTTIPAVLRRRGAK